MTMGELWYNTLRPGAWWNGRHAGFRFQFREEWGFKSPRAQYPNPQLLITNPYSVYNCLSPMIFLYSISDSGTINFWGFFSFHRL